MYKNRERREIRRNPQKSTETPYQKLQARLQAKTLAPIVNQRLKL